MTTRLQGPRRRGFVLGAALALLGALVPAQAAMAGPTCTVEGTAIEVTADGNAFVRIRSTQTGGKSVDVDQSGLQATCPWPQGFNALRITGSGGPSLDLGTQVLLGRLGIAVDVSGFSDVAFGYSDEQAPGAEDVAGQTGADVLIDTAFGPEGTPDVRIRAPERIGLYGSAVLDAGGSPETGGPVTLPHRLTGGPRSDVLRAGAGPAQLSGGSGDDDLRGGPAEDVLAAGDGDDTVDSSGDGRADTVDCGSGRDRGAADGLDELNDCEFQVPLVRLVRQRVPFEQSPSVGEGAGAARLQVELVGSSTQPVQVRVVTPVLPPTLSRAATAGQDFTVIDETLTFSPGGPTALPFEVPILQDDAYEDSEFIEIALSSPQARSEDGLVFITDDDPQATASPQDAEVVEGGTADVRVVFDRGARKPVNGTLVVAGTDRYPFTMRQGELEVRVAVPTQDDAVAGGDRRLSLTVTDVPGDIAVGPPATLVVRDDEPARTVVARSATVVEGGAASVEVVLDQASDQPVEARLAAGAGESVPVRIEPGATSVFVSLPTAGNDTFDGDRQLPLTLSAVTGASAGTSGTLTVRDDEPAPAVAVAGGEVREGATVPITITLGGRASVPVTRGLRVVASSAAADELDVDPASVTFAPGQTEAKVQVTARADGLDEPGEAVVLQPTGAPEGVLDTAGEIRIEDADAAPVVSAGDATGTEGGTARVRLALQGRSARELTVRVGTAGVEPVLATFAAGGTQAEVDLPVPDDAVFQGPAGRRQALVLSDPRPAGALAAGEAGTLTIADDEAAPAVRAGDVTVDEGGAAEVVLTLEREAAVRVSRTVSTLAGTAGAQDFTAIADREVVFEPGTTQRTVAVQTTPDALDEPDEALTLVPSGAPQGVTDRAATITVRDDDASPVLAAQDAQATEGSPVDVVVALSGATERRVEASLRVGDAAFPVSIAPGDRQAVVPVPVPGNDVDDGDRDVALRVTEVSGAEPGPDGTLRVLDDDEAPRASAASATGREGGTARVEVSLSGRSAREVSIEVGTAGATPVVARFAAGATQTTVDLPVPDDDVFQGADRTQPLVLREPDGVQAGPAGELTIEDDERAPIVTAADVEVGEGGRAEVELRLSGPAADPVVRTVSTRAGTASAADFQAIVAREVTFPAGTTTQAVEVVAEQDEVREGAEAFALVPSGTEDEPGTITITDDEPVPTLRAADASGSEGATVEVEVALSGKTDEAVTATLGAAGVDPVAVRLEAGSRSARVALVLPQDEVDGEDRTLPLRLTDVAGAAAAADQGSLLVRDDDDVPVVNAGDGTGTEGGTADVGLALTRASSRTLTVRVATAGAAPVTATFPAGTTRTSVALDVPDDELYQGEVRRQAIRLADPSDGVVAGEAGELAVRDDEAVPAVTVARTEVAEGEAAEVELTLAPRAAKAVTRTVSTVAGTATAGDFQALSGVEVTFPAETAKRTVTVGTTEDEVDEPDEALDVVVGGAPEGVEDRDGTVVITDDDATPVITAGDAETTEGTPARVEVALSGASSRPVEGTLRGVAVRLEPLQRTVEVALPFPDNDTYDGDRRAILRLVDVTGATPGRDGELTLRDDEPVPSVAVGDAELDEGTGAQLRLTLSGRASIPITRDLAIEPGTASADDVVLAADEVTFAPGQTERAVRADARADGVDEPQERLAVAPRGGPEGVADTAGTVVVRDADATPRVTAADAAGTEGGTATVRLTLSGRSSRALAVDVGTEGAKAVRAAFPAGRTTAEVELPVPGDDVFQGADRRQPLTLAAPSDALEVGEAGTLTITDDEAAPAASVQDVTVAEGREAEVAIVLDRAAATAVVRTVSTRAGTAGAGDFAAIEAREVTFPAGTTRRTVTVRAEADGTAEPAETFSLAVGGAPAGVTDRAGTVTITDVPPAGGVQGQRTSGSGTAAASCTLDLTLLDARRAGSRVLVTGYAPRLAGQTVVVTADGRPAARAVIAQGGLFQLLVRRAGRYGASVGDVVARGLRLERRLVLTRVTQVRGGYTLAGRLAVPARGRPRTIELQRRSGSCAQQTTRRLRVGRDGRFTTQLARPAAGEALVLYRLVAKLPQGRTFSTPVVVLP